MCSTEFMFVSLESSSTSTNPKGPQKGTFGDYQSDIFRDQVPHCHPINNTTSLTEQLIIHWAT